MNEFVETLNLFIGNVIAYTFLVAVYGFIIYNVGKVILYLIRYAVYHIRRDINKYNPIKINSNTAGGRDFSAACFVERTTS